MDNEQQLIDFIDAASIEEQTEIVRARIEQDVYDTILELGSPQTASDEVSKAWVDATTKVLNAYVEAGILANA